MSANFAFIEAPGSWPPGWGGHQPKPVRRKKFSDGILGTLRKASPTYYAYILIKPRYPNHSWQKRTQRGTADFFCIPL